MHSMGFPGLEGSRGLRNENEQVEVGRHEISCHSGVVGP